jgi:hypothetical protein
MKGEGGKILKDEADKHTQELIPLQKYGIVFVRRTPVLGGGK